MRLVARFILYTLAPFFKAFLLGPRNYIHSVSEVLPDPQFIPIPNMRKLPTLFQSLVLPWSKFWKARILSSSPFILTYAGMKRLIMQSWEGELKVSIGSYHLFSC